MSSFFSFHRFPIKFSVSRHFQPAIYTVCHVESEFAAQNIQILQPSEKKQVFQNLKNIGNVSPENLLRVTPIPKDINRIKIGLDGTYNNILSALRSGDTYPALLKQKTVL